MTLTVNCGVCGKLWPDDDCVSIVFDGIIKPVCSVCTERSWDERAEEYLREDFDD